MYATSHARCPRFRVRFLGANLDAAEMARDQSELLQEQTRERLSFFGAEFETASGMGFASKFARRPT
jgi:hypothetical protein